MILKVCSSQSESGLSVWSLLTAQRFGQVKPMTAAGRAWRRVLRVFPTLAFLLYHYFCKYETLEMKVTSAALRPRLLVEKKKTVAA